MPAYIIGHISIKNPEKWNAYRSQVGATFAAWGGELVFRGNTVEVLNGVHPQTDTVVARFPDKEAIHAWHQSAQYQALIPLRDAGADVVLISLDATA
ncbi:DUF1330 domain-containing protein [Noviherbaspirillum saxi]|uniref:DUF1330 domain-containing protein n=1 Tax=Noviherbaspirillum saxi TaxID=2320863 RepID=A0A3A3FNR4_9BURK|nr:DUF1330 domain-containing protein [Noviherbaspirillum saxi]RJF97533.1 DUF1330 domain-containing protein [Noviherbaspirillum saxi]